MINLIFTSVPREGHTGKMKRSTRKSFAIVFAVVMTVSMVGMGAASLSSSGGAQVYEQQTDDLSAVDIDVDTDALADGERHKVIVRLTPADRAMLDGDRAAVVNSLESHADATQAGVLAWAEATDGVAVNNNFWIMNAVSLTISEEAHLEEIARLDHVERIHESHTFELEEPELNAVDPNDDDLTYGLDMHNVSDVWDMGITGEGATVASLDTGIDPDHPDWEDRVTDDHYQQWDGSGNPTDDPPSDISGHGTHVAGTIAGPAEPADPDQPQYGVAPDAEVYHGNVIPGGSGTFEDVAAGMEWAVDEVEADVMGLSLGGGLTLPDLIEATENAHEAGVIVSASNGNNTPSTPGFYYSSYGSQAIDENKNPASFAVYDYIDPVEVWGDDAPEWWPDEYLSPDASAAGVNVLSSHSTSGSMCPGAEYCEVSGTSMSQPHKAGIFALMASGAGGTDNVHFQEVMSDTAIDIGDDPVFGAGMVDALGAVQMVAHDQEIEGTVSGADGEPLEGADVTVDDTGIGATTDADGFYSIIHEAGTFDVTADGFGHAPQTEEVELEEEETAIQDFDLDAALDAALLEDQPDAIEAGDEVSAVVLAANADTVTVDEVAGYDGDMSLTVDGEDAELGEAVDLDMDDWYGEVEVVVETEDDVAGDVELEHTFAGEGDELSITTGPTAVFEEYVAVAVVDDAGTYGDEVAERLEGELSEQFDIEVVAAGEAEDGYDVVVVQQIDEDNAADFIDATEGDDVGVVYLDQWGTGSNAIPVHSDETGEPESTYQDDFVDTPITYELEVDHEIFDGVGEAGDSVDIHSATFADHTWFEGTDFDVLAQTGIVGDPVGDAFAIDDESATIFASGLGHTLFVGSGDYTSDADAILANSVEYLGTSDEAPPEPSDGTVGVIDDGAAGEGDYERDGEFDPLMGEDVVERLEAVLPEEFEVDLIDSEEALEAAEDGEYDVFVAHDIDPDVVEEFDDLTAGDAAGVVWLDQWGMSYANAISDKSDVLGNPDSTSQSSLGDNPDLEILADHEIFDGVGDEGDVVPIHEATFSDRSWFDDYDGEVLGNIKSGGDVDGEGVGIDEEKGTILLSSLGSSSWVSGDDFTDEAETLLGNSVEFLADADPSEPAPETTMSIEDANVSEHVPGDTTPVTAESDEAIAGFQTFVEFDADKVSIEGVHEADFDTIAYEYDNDEGWLRIAGAAAEGMDDPTLAEIEFDTSMEPAEETTLELTDESVLNDDQGAKLDTELDHATIKMLHYNLGDVLNDGEIHSGDAVVVQAYLAGLDIPVPAEQVETYGDVTQTGEVTSADVTYILQYVTDPDHPGFTPAEEGETLSVTAPTPAAGLLG